LAGSDRSNSKAADYIDESLNIPDPRIGFFIADLPASLSIVWVAVRISDVSIRILFFPPVKKHDALGLSPNYRHETLSWFYSHIGLPRGFQLEDLMPNRIPVILLVGRGAVKQKCGAFELQIILLA
jgi:hypothetical protein